MRERTVSAMNNVVKVIIILIVICVWYHVLIAIDMTDFSVVSDYVALRFFFQNEISWIGIIPYNFMKFRHFFENYSQKD